MTTLSQRELAPFAAAIDAGVDAVLTAHLVADAIDIEPVSLSATWTKHLREAMGFDGVIITDALDMDAVAKGRGVAGVADAAVHALCAEADFLCLGSNFDDSMTNMVIDRVVSAIGDGHIERMALDRSQRRVAALQQRSVSPVGCNTRAAQEVAERAIVIDGQLPGGPFAVLECRPAGSMACFNVTWGIADSLRRRGWPMTTIIESDPIEQSCAGLLEEAGDLPVLVVVRDVGVHSWQNAVIDTLVRARPSSVVVAELGWPGDRPVGAVAHVVTHGAARASAQALIDHLVVPCLVHPSPDDTEP